jgi:tetratricopeptide (TPR) repeat protein
MALLACLFYILSLGMYLSTRLQIIRRKILGFLSAGVLLVCAVFSKENAFTLLAAIILVEVILFRQSLRTALKFVAIGVVAAVMVFAAVVVTEKLPGSEEAGVFHLIRLYYRISGLTPLEVALTQSRMFFDYLSLLLAPFWFDMPFWVAPIISRSLLNPPATALAVGGVFALIGLSLALLRRRPLLSFGMLFFILNLIPESALVPSHIFFAYRAILPLMGLTLVAADLALAALKWTGNRGVRQKVQLALAATLVIWIAAAAVTTVSRALIWVDPVLVWKEAARHLPPPDADCDRMHYVAILDSFGFELQQKGRHKEAVQYHELSLKMYPSNMRGLTFMASALAGSGDPADAEVYFKKAFEARATDGRAPVFARTTYGDFLERRARKPEAADQYAEALKIRPDAASLQKKLGTLRMELGEAAEAEKCFRNALAHEPHSPQAHYDLAAALKTQGRLDEAIRHYQEAVRLKPDYAWAHNNLGRAMEEKGDTIAALACYAKALQYDKNLAEAHLNMGNALAGMNKLDDSIRHYKAAITIRPDFSQAHNNVAAVLEEKGDLKRAAEHYKLATQLRPDIETFAKNLARVMNKLQQ